MTYEPVGCVFYMFNKMKGLLRCLRERSLAVQVRIIL